jgi:DNA-binding MarR family transcriptional regulator
MAERAPAPVKSLAVLEGPAEARLRTWLQLVRTFHRIYRRLESTLAAHEVTVPQFDILATLRFSEGITQRELAERLLVTKGNVCGVLDRLERVGWVERRPDPVDARANRLHLTPAGRRKLGVVLPRHDALVLRALRTLPPADVKSLRRILEELERVNDEDREP